MVKCEYCGEETSRKRFCSRVCYDTWKIGKTNVQMLGKAKAEQCRIKQSKKAKGRPSKLKGKTYEEVYGIKKAKELKKSKFKNVDRHQHKGKTYEEIYGEEEAKRLRAIRSKDAHEKPRWGKSDGIFECKICGMKMNARYGLHKKWHESGHDKKHKCENDKCTEMVGYTHRTCSYKCSATLRCKEIGKDKMSEIKRKSLMENPNSHPCRLCGGMGRNKMFASFPQMALFDAVKSAFGEAELNYPVNTGKTVRYLDVAIILDKIAFEYDGEYWHKDRKNIDEQRDLELSALGWTVYHFTKKDNFDEKILSIVEGVLCDKEG